MKKSELRNVIKEEIYKILNEQTYQEQLENYVRRIVELRKKIQDTKDVHEKRRIGQTLRNTEKKRHDLLRKMGQNYYQIPR